MKRMSLMSDSEINHHIKNDKRSGWEFLEALNELFQFHLKAEISSQKIYVDVPNI